MMLLPALSLKLDRTSAPGVRESFAPTEPAMITSPRDTALLATWAKGSGLAVPSLPAATTMMTPAAVARLIALLTGAPGTDPPSEMLMTRAPALTARSIPLPIAVSLNEQPLSPSLFLVAQEPGVSART